MYHDTSSIRQQHNQQQILLLASSMMNGQEQEDAATIPTTPQLSQRKRKRTISSDKNTSRCSTTMKRRRLSSDDETSSSCTKKTIIKKSVHFASKMRVRLCRKRSTASSTWYSETNYQQFKQNAKRDTAAFAVNSHKANQYPHELCSRGLERHIIGAAGLPHENKKAQRIQAVLDEQYHQKLLFGNTEINRREQILAQISQSYSETSRQVALERAANDATIWK